MKNDSGRCTYLLYRIRNISSGNDEYYFLDDENMTLEPLNSLTREGSEVILPNQTIILTGHTVSTDSDSEIDIETMTNTPSNLWARIDAGCRVIVQFDYGTKARTAEYYYAPDEDDYRYYYFKSLDSDTNSIKIYRLIGDNTLTLENTLTLTPEEEQAVWVSNECYLELVIQVNNKILPYTNNIG